ncbi:MAG: PH domain-containing protein [Nitrososphaerota archaeon]|nr:PH domain-containing protein [Nitrososphaerota archaeon]
MWPATSTSPQQRDEKRLRSNVSKSLIKGTLLVAVLVPFLQINPRTYADFAIFLGLSYASIGAYMLFKESTVYALGDTGIVIRRPMRKENFIPYDSIQELSIAQGMLAKRFGCGSVYVALKKGKGKGTHTSSMGQGVFVLKDVPAPGDVYREISDMTSPFAAAA